MTLLHETELCNVPSQDRDTLTTRPRIAFLGVGWIGRHRMEAIAQAGLADIVAIADPVQEMAEQAAELAPGAALLSSIDDVLSLDIDGLVIATPSAQHADQAIAALERGIAVLCQKPLARTAEETRRVVHAARHANRLLSVDFSYRFITGMATIRDLVRSGELGDVYAATLVFHNAYGPDKPWFYNPALSGGGCVMDLGVHLVDLALWTFDYPEVAGVSSRLFAGGRRVATPADTVEDYATAQFDLATGPSVQLACSWKLSAGCDAVIEASFYGTKGGATLRNIGGSFYDFTAERFRGTARETLSSSPDEWGGRAAVDWATRLAAGERFDLRNDYLVDVATVLDAIYGR